MITSKIQRYLDPSDVRQFDSTINAETFLLRDPNIDYMHPYYDMKQYKKYKRFYGEGFLVVENGSSLLGILELDKRLTSASRPELLKYTTICGVYVPIYFNYINKLQALNMVWYTLPIRPKSII